MASVFYLPLHCVCSSAISNFVHYCIDSAKSQSLASGFVLLISKQCVISHGLLKACDFSGLIWAWKDTSPLSSNHDGSVSVSSGLYGIYLEIDSKSV